MLSYLGVPLAAMSARHEPLAAVLLQVLGCVPPLHLRTALVLAVHWLVTAVALVFLQIDNMMLKMVDNFKEIIETEN